MLSKRGFIAEMRERVLNKIVFNAFADEEPSQGEDSKGGNNPINYEQLIALARKEEKDKLYPKIKALEKENKTLIENANNYLIEIGNLKTQISELTSKSDKGVDIEQLQKDYDDLKTKFDTLAGEKEELENRLNDVVPEEELRATITKEFEVKYYLDSQKSEHEGEILPMFMNDITGSTNEEIDESISNAINKTLEIKKQLGLIDEDGNEVKSKSASDEKSNKEEGKKRKDVPPANPKSNENVTKYTASYIQSLDPSSEEYRKFRAELGLK